LAVLDSSIDIQALRAGHAQQVLLSRFNFQLENGPRQAVDHMTFIIEAVKDDHYTTDIRSSAVVAVILARKLAADGFAVSIRAPTGLLYSADRFNQLLTNKNAQETGDDG
jgi:hypothetical protein